MIHLCFEQNRFDPQGHPLLQGFAQQLIDDVFLIEDLWSNDVNPTAGNSFRVPEADDGYHQSTDEYAAFVRAMNAFA